MRYESEVRWRFKGDPGLCSRYIPQARTFCAVTMSLQGDGVETYQLRKELPDGARLKVMKFPAMVPIIEIDVSNVAADESPKLRGFIVHPWETGFSPAIGGSYHELVLGYISQGATNSYYTYWPSKATPQYGQARRNLVYLPKLPAGVSKFGEILWTNGSLSCSVHGPSSRYWSYGITGTPFGIFRKEHVPSYSMGNAVYSCGRQIYDSTSLDAAQNDPYLGFIYAAAMRREGGQTRLFMLRRHVGNYVLVSYKLVGSPDDSATHMLDCRSARLHAQTAQNSPTTAEYPISTWLFNASCTAVSAVFDTVFDFGGEDDLRYEQNPSVIVTYSDSGGAWTRTETVRSPNVEVVQPLDFYYPYTYYDTNDTVVGRNYGTAHASVTGIVVAVDYDGDELVEIAVDYEVEIRTGQHLAYEYHKLPGQPTCSGSNLYSALAYINAQSATGYVDALHPGVTGEDREQLIDSWQNYIDYTTAQLGTLIATHESTVAGHPARLALEQNKLSRKGYRAYLELFRIRAILNYNGESIVLEDANISATNSVTADQIPFIGTNPQGGFGLCTTVNIGMPETMCPGNSGQRANNFFASVADGTAWNALEAGYPDGTDIVQYQTGHARGSFEVNGCEYLITYEYGAAGDRTDVGHDGYTFSFSPSLASVTYKLQKILSLDAALKAAVVAEYQHTYNTPHLLYLPEPNDSALWSHYTSVYPRSNNHYCEGKLRTKVVAGDVTESGSWFELDTESMLDPALPRRTDGMMPAQQPGMFGASSAPWQVDKASPHLPMSSARVAILRFLSPVLFAWSDSATSDRLYDRRLQDWQGGKRPYASIAGYGSRVLVASFSYGDDAAVSWMSGGTNPNEQTGFDPLTRMYPASFFPKYIIEDAE